MATPEQLDEVVQDLMTAREAAQVLRVHLRTLKYWKAREYGPDHFYIGKRLFYRRSEVIEWIERTSARKVPVNKGRKVRP